ncbi:hypothetical protein [Streptomyces sp. NPDC001717]|uniref:hypothetical protein n=1 Tax=Streptomyces sp. NPDC001717 TaxID=3364604 RepID=UPI0036C1B9EA
MAAALLVPLLTVAGVATSLRTQEIEHEWADRQIEACRHLPFPVTEYVAAWAGVGLGLMAVAVSGTDPAVRRVLGRRDGD